MLHKPSLISPTPACWNEIATLMLEHPALAQKATHAVRNMSSLRVVVPNYSHAQLLKTALARRFGRDPAASAFIPPRIVTLSNWCAQLPPDADEPVAASSRLMSLYAELRQHAWLKKWFSARRNTDLLPLANLLLTLSDELTVSLLPSIWGDHASADSRWQQALEQLTPAARTMISDEAQLVWSIWKSQLDGSDAMVMRYRRLMRLAAAADTPLVWIAPAAISPIDEAFLRAYAERQPVLPIAIDWGSAAIAPAMTMAWPELRDDWQDTHATHATHPVDIDTPAQLSLCAARSMEQEAQSGAQIILDWLRAGKTEIAIIAQDRVVARRMRALLERAQVYVADETGWKLSTTRAASAMAAWFDVISARAETIALLDLLKSPFVFATYADKQERLMTMESRLRRANILGGWESISAALTAHEPALELVQMMAQQAALFGGRKTIREWSATTESALNVLGMWTALLEDAAGAQVVALLQTIVAECGGEMQTYSFAEWRAFVGLQLESTSFVAPALDRRVVMLPLNGAQLRTFDAVLMVGCDAEHLPSQAAEMLFFANAVRRELGLSTRESLQRQQLRDFATLLCGNTEVVLSWQTHQNGEPNPISPWIERLQLILARAGANALPMRQVQIGMQELSAIYPVMPAPAAPHLIPAKLSASGYNSLLDCPYQFFASRMLALSGMEELSDMPEKRDYGDWLHNILNQYHTTIRDTKTPLPEREQLLRRISAEVFAKELDNSAAALGYVTRWKKIIPAYLEWANQREANGWQFVSGEQKFEKKLEWDNGKIILHGRIDRIDENLDGERAVLDYKTKNVVALKDKLKQGEDRQLAFYGMLTDGTAQYAHYVALEATKDKVGDVAATDFPASTQALTQQLRDNLQSISQGTPLPATGIEAVCGYCAVRGMCRKGAW